MNTRLTIDVQDSKKAKLMVNNLLQNNSLNVQKAIIRYCDKDHRIKSREPIYPLEIQCDMYGETVIVRVDSVTAGNHEETSKDLVDILRNIDVDFHEDDILTQRCMCERSGYICLIYEKNTDN